MGLEFLVLQNRNKDLAALLGYNQLFFWCYTERMQQIKKSNQVLLSY